MFFFFCHFQNTSDSHRHRVLFVTFKLISSLNSLPSSHCLFLTKSSWVSPAERVSHDHCFSSHAFLSAFFFSTKPTNHLFLCSHSTPPLYAKLITVPPSPLFFLLCYSNIAFIQGPGISHTDEESNVA